MNNIAVESSSKKSWVILVTALVLGGLAAWLSSFYLDYKEDQIRDSLTGKKEVKVAIVVPKFKVGPGDIISGDNMVVRKIPKRYVPDGAFDPSQFESLMGRTIVAPISAGKPLLETSIAGVGIEQFSDLLTAGERAITLPMDEFNSTAGMLVAGDRIDLFLIADENIITGNQSDGNASALYLLLQNAVVLATGKSTVEDSAIRLSDESEFEQYNTITLGVTLRDAGRIGLARQDGKFVAMLRNREDDKKVKHQLIDSSDVYMNVAKNKHQVEYIIGGAGSSGIASVTEQSVEIQKLANKLNQLSQLSESAK